MGEAMNRLSDASMTTHMESAPKVNPLRVVAAALMLALGVGILAVAMSGSEAANRDYDEYWAVGHQLVHHGNPYDSAAVLRILQAGGCKGTSHMILRNPPSALFITLPLGFVNMRVGAIVWSLALIAALMASIRMLWIIQGRPQDRLHLLGYIFPPALACLLAGQIGIFLLLGATLFLYLHASRPYLAGAALVLCSLKPHLFLPFGVVLFAWIVSRRAYPILMGALATLMASSALSLYLDPGILSHYVHGEKAENIQNLFIPCLSVLFRVAIHRSAVWLQFLPALAGCVWGIWYFSTRRDRWSWIEYGPLLLLVSAMVAPYAWFTDEAILVPAILAGLYRASNAGRSLLPFGCIAGVALIEVVAGVPLTTGFYLWTAPTWLAWYLYAVRGTTQGATIQMNYEVRDGYVASRPALNEMKENTVETK
jgi:hypothetical protein